MPSINAYMQKKQYDFATARAQYIANKKDLPFNRSAVVAEALECLEKNLELFGDDWREGLQVQSEPAYIKRLEERIIKHLDSIAVAPVSQPEEDIDDNDYGGLGDMIG